MNQNDHEGKIYRLSSSQTKKISKVSKVSLRLRFEMIFNIADKREKLKAI